MKLTETNARMWSLLVAPYMICRTCSYVDLDRGRMRAGHICQKCGHESNGAMLYFHVNIMVLIDLLEESYLSRPKNLSEEVAPANVAILLFFCTLKEALFEHFLRQLFASLSLKKSVQKKLLSDNRLFHEKLRSLLPALIEDDWSAALVNASRLCGQDFLSLDSVLTSSARTRNKFLHDASPWDISVKLADTCIDSIAAMLVLFVALHNHYVYGGWEKVHGVA
jgi:hypothetical protein